MVKHDMGRVLLKLEELQDAQIQRALRPETKTVTLSDTDRAEALELLRSPNLLKQILEDFDKLLHYTKNIPYLQLQFPFTNYTKQ